VGDTRLEESSGHGGYAFGPFVVDPVKRRLWREGRLVPITSKTFDVLVVLLEHREHIISKDELLNRVWPNTSVNEKNLARQISSLRRALGQRPDQHDFVVAIPGHGYRFVASVQNLTDVPSELHTDREVHLHVLPEPAVDLEDPRAGDRLLPDQLIPEVNADDAAPRLSTIFSGPRIYLGILVASCGVLAVAIAVALLRPANPESQPRRNLQRITSTR
jgi:DNA-binding winged helix-turn-helix (wHTH) protein